MDFTLEGVPQVTLDVAVRETDVTFTLRAVKMADVPRDLRTCFACGRFVAKLRWQLDLSRRKLPVCADCDHYRDWQP